MVAGGTLFSTFWILATNSWMETMQTPAGYRIVDGRFVPQNWAAINFADHPHVQRVLYWVFRGKGARGHRLSLGACGRPARCRVP